MKLKHYLGIVFAFGMLFAACNQEEKTLKEYMVNSWETSYINIKMPTYKLSDSTFVFEDNFQNNPPRIAQSKYEKDGTFVAWYLDRDKTRQGDAPGTWKIKGDSLYIEYTYNGRASKIAYHVTITEEGFKAVSKYDWDEDGEFDDLLTMKTKQIILKE